MRSPTVASVMTTQVAVIHPDTPFADIVRLLDQRRISAVPVINERQALVGVVSEADLLTKEAAKTPAAVARGPANSSERKSRGRIARDLMSRPVATIRADDVVAEAAWHLARAGMRRLFVVDNTGRLCGVVSRRDVLSLFLRTDEQLAAAVRREVLTQGVPLDQKRISVEVDGGVVTLAGVTGCRSDAERAARMTAALPGVVGVTDHLAYDVDDLPARPG